MNVYETLAEELIEAFDRKKKELPHEEVSAAMRGEMAVLRLLEDEARALTAGEISRMLRMTTSRIAAVLGTLEKKGLIIRSPDERDKRRIRVSLTQKGCALCRAKRQKLVHDVCFALSQLGEHDAREFVRLMKRVHDLMPPPDGLCSDEEEREEGGIDPNE